MIARMLYDDKRDKNTSRTSLKDRNEGRLFSSISFLQLLRNKAFPAPSRFHVSNSAPPKKHIYMYKYLGWTARRLVTTSPRNRNDKVRLKLHVWHLDFFHGFRLVRPHQPRILYLQPLPQLFYHKQTEVTIRDFTRFVNWQEKLVFGFRWHLTHPHSETKTESTSRNHTKPIRIS